MQTFSSRNTSINVKKLPAIYSKINWDKFKGSVILDYGVGRLETQKLIVDFLHQYDIAMMPYDPYWVPDYVNEYALKLLDEGFYDIVVCSNILNVLQDDAMLDTIGDLQYGATDAAKVFVKIYEGNKSGIGKQSQHDAWQRNEPTSAYVERLNRDLEEPLFVLHKGIITNYKEGVL